MMIPDILANGPPPLLATVGALSAGFVPLILQANTFFEQKSLHPLDATDPAGWNRSEEWSLYAPIEKRYRLPGCSSVIVAEHSSGQWRTLRRHGSVQSVTLMQPPRLSEEEDDNDDLLVPFHSSVGNEYLKVMASAYAALSDGDGGEMNQQLHDNDDNDNNDNNDNNKLSRSSILHLGVGGGSLPMLIGEPCTAIEIDGDAIELAIEYCGLDPEMVNIVKGGDALHHRTLAPGPHSCIFVDVFGEDNNVPLPFVEEEFVKGLYDSLDDEDGGIVIANFHCNNGRFSKNEEDDRLDQATRVYSRVFGGDSSSSPSSSSSSCLVRIPSRYQGNMILCARKGGKDGSYVNQLSLEDFDIETARHVATLKGWRFDPGARLENAETVLF